MRIKKTDLVEIADRLDAQPLGKGNYEPAPRDMVCVAYSLGQYGRNWAIWQDQTTGIFYHGGGAYLYYYNI